MNEVDLSTPAIEWLAILPAVVVAAAGVMIVLGRSLAKRAPGVFAASALTAFVGVIGALVFTAYQWTQVRNDGPYTTFGGMVALDGFAVFLSIVVLIATLLALLVSIGYLRREEIEAPEYLALLLFSSAGMLLMTSLLKSSCDGEHSHEPPFGFRRMPWLRTAAAPTFR